MMAGKKVNKFRKPWNCAHLCLQPLAGRGKATWKCVRFYSWSPLDLGWKKSQRLPELAQWKIFSCRHANSQGEAMPLYSHPISWRTGRFARFASLLVTCPVQLSPLCSMLGAKLQILPL